MTVTTTQYNNYDTHEGTLKEVMDVIKGSPASYVISVMGNADLTSFVMIARHKWLNGNDK